MTNRTVLSLSVLLCIVGTMFTSNYDQTSSPFTGNSWDGEKGIERIFNNGDLKPTKRIIHSEKPKTSEFTLHIRIVHRDMLDRFYVM